MAGTSRRQHVLSFDDGPFDKRRDREAWVVGVVTAGPGLVEGVLMTRVPIDGDDVTGRLARWIRGSRFHASLRGVLLEGITIAGLCVVDLPELASRTGLPVVSVERKLPRVGLLEATLAKVGFADRVAAVAAAGPFHAWRGLHFHAAGIAPERATTLLEQSRGRSKLPEGIRIAHLVARAIVEGECRARG